MKHRNYKRPKKIKPKEQRRPMTGDEYELLDTLDWVGDIERRKWLKSEKYAEGAALLEKWAKK